MLLSEAGVELVLEHARLHEQKHRANLLGGKSNSSGTVNSAGGAR